MSPLGGLMKILLGGLLGWAFVSGALSRFTDQVGAALGAPAGAAPASSQGGAAASGGIA